jgi:hypothetical protein
MELKEAIIKAIIEEIADNDKLNFWGELKCNGQLIFCEFNYYNYYREGQRDVSLKIVYLENELGESINTNLFEQKVCKILNEISG